MAFTLGDAIVYFKGDDSQLKKDTQTAESGVSGFVGNATKMLGGALVGATVAAGAALVGVGAAGVSSFISFETKMNEVFTLLPGMSKSAMNDMSEQVKTFSKDFGVLPDEVVPALYQALSAGVPKENVFEFLETANKAAVGGVSSLETAVDGISSVVNAYGSDIISAAEASDLMFSTVRLGKTNFDELSSSLFQVIPTAAGLGVEFGDVTAALASMTLQGTPTAVATTQLRQLFVELSSAGGATAEAFEKVAGESFVDFVAGGGNVQEALQLMEQAAAANDVRLSDMFGSVEAGNAALALTGKGAESFSSNLAAMAEAGGATDAAFEQMNTGIQDALDDMKVAWEVALLDIGKAIAPLIEMILPALSGAIAAIIPFVVDLFEALATLVGYFKIVVTDGDTLNDFLVDLPTPIQGLVKVIGDAVAYVTGLFRGDLSLSIGDAAGRFDFIQERINTIMPLIQQIVETVLGAIAEFWTAHGETVMELVGNAFEFIMETVTVTLDLLLQFIQLFLQVITGDWEGAGQTLISIAETLWEHIKNVFSLALDSLKLMFGNIDWGALGRGILEGIANGILGGIGIIVDAAERAAQSAYDAAKDWLGIGSPSKKAAEGLGKPFSQGLAEGAMKEMQGISGLNLGLQALFQGSQPQQAGMAAGNAISIVINVGEGGGAVSQSVRGGVLDALRQAGLR